MYVAYLVLVVNVIPRDSDGQQAFADDDSWPNSWHNSGIGKAGLVLVGMAFLAAVIVQLEQFFTKSFHNTIKDEFYRMPKVGHTVGWQSIVLENTAVCGLAGAIVKSLMITLYGGAAPLGHSMGLLQDPVALMTRCRLSIILASVLQQCQNWLTLTFACSECGSRSASLC